MEVWGHRGSRLPGPENTPEAVRAALTAGADGCEVDVRRTADDGLVCHHDPLTSHRPVVAATLEELTAAGVAALADVAAAGAAGRLVLEVKNTAGDPDYTPDAYTAQLLVAALDTLTGRPGSGGLDLLISSFDGVALDVAQAAGRRTALLTLPGVPVADGLAYASAAGCSELHAHVSVITEPASAVHAAGLRLVGWTVTTVAQALGLGGLGVDAVICDDPAEIVAGSARGDRPEPA